MRSLLLVLLCVLVSCGAGDDDDCDGGGDATLIDLHTTQRLGDLLDERDGDARTVMLQDGGPACPWRAVAGTGSGHYALAVHGARYAVAVTCEETLTVLARTADDGGELAHACFSSELVEPIELRAHTVAGATPYVIGASMGNTSTSRQSASGNVAIGFLWHALDGVYDLVAVGHPGDDNLDAPDNVRVIRDLRAADAFDIDVTPTASPEWIAFGPTVPVTAGANTIASLRYKTTHGTFVDLGTAIGTATPQTVAAPTFPAAARAPGDLYEQAMYVEAFDAGKAFIITRTTAEPTAFDMALPPVFTATLDRTTFSFAHVADATSYQVTCLTTTGGSFTSNFSADWLGYDGAYTLPSIPGVRYPDDCRWTASAIGRTAPSDTWESATGVRSP
jgi:hypothetical protein